MRLQFRRLALYLTDIGSFISFSSLMSGLGEPQKVSPDRVVRLESDPVGNGSVLFGLFAENALDAERLLRRLFVKG